MRPVACACGALPPADDDERRDEVSSGQLTLDGSMLNKHKHKAGMAAQERGACAVWSWELTLTKLSKSKYHPFCKGGSLHVCVLTAECGVSTRS